MNRNQIIGAIIAVLTALGGGTYLYRDSGFGTRGSGDAAAVESKEILTEAEIQQFENLQSQFADAGAQLRELQRTFVRATQQQQEVQQKVGAVCAEALKARGYQPGQMTCDWQNGRVTAVQAPAAAAAPSP